MLPLDVSAEGQCVFTKCCLGIIIIDHMLPSIRLAQRARLAAEGRLSSSATTTGDKAVGDNWAGREG